MRLAIIGAAGQIPGFLIPRLLEETDFKLTLAGRKVSQRLSYQDVPS